MLGRKASISRELQPIITALRVGGVGRKKLQDGRGGIIKVSAAKMYIKERRDGGAKVLLWCCPWTSFLMNWKTESSDKNQSAQFLVFQPLRVTKGNEHTLKKVGLQYTKCLLFFFSFRLFSGIEFDYDGFHAAFSASSHSWSHLAGGLLTAVPTVAQCFGMDFIDAQTSISPIQCRKDVLSLKIFRKSNTISAWSNNNDIIAVIASLIK